MAEKRDTTNQAEMNQVPTVACRATSLEIPRLSLGTMTFGGQADEATSRRMMDMAWDAGMFLFDTANIYNAGQSEEIIGRWIQDRIESEGQGFRDQLILASKVRGAMGEGPNRSGLSRRAILAAVRDSLARLQTDYLDIYYLHQPDYGTAIEESLQTMDDLIREGKIRYWAISNYAAWQLAEILHLCEAMQIPPPILTQNVYNVLTRGLEGELLPLLNTHSRAPSLTVYNPLAGGLLTGKHKIDPLEGTRLADNPMYNTRYWKPSYLKAAKSYVELAEKVGREPTSLAFAWLKAQPHVDSILVGASKPEQLEQNLKAMEEDVPSDEIIAELDAIWLQLSGDTFAYYR